MPTCICPVGYYHNGAAQCETCSSGCLTCSYGNSCDTCKSSSPARIFASLCICPNGYYDNATE